MVESQQMFMLFFSILYGIMLNSLIGLGAFPLGAAIAGKDVKSKDDEKKKVDWIDGYKCRNRVILSFILLNILPFVYFGLSFQHIGDVIGDLPSTELVYTIPQILFIGLLSLGVFAFYRFFIGLVVWQPCGNSLFYSQYEIEEKTHERAIHGRSRNHILAGFMYLIPLILLLIIVTL